MIDTLDDAAYARFCFRFEYLFDAIFDYYDTIISGHFDERRLSLVCLLAAYLTQLIATSDSC